MKRIKVLQLQQASEGSTAAVGQMIMECLSSVDYEVVTATLSGSMESSPNDAKRGNYISLGFRPWAMRGIGRFWSVLKLIGFCRKHRFDIIIAHRFKPIHMALMVGRFLDIPIICVVHAIGDYDRKYRQRLLHKLIRPTDRFVAVSSAVREYLLSLHCGLIKSNTLIINNAIDFARAEEQLLEPASARAALELPSERLIVGTIGRLVPVKGHRLLIEAASLLIEKHPDLLVVIIGEGRERAKLEALISQSSLQDNVRLLGHRDEAFRYLRAFDVFALPSYSEGFPLVLLEAMSARLPIVGSDIPSIASVIDGYGWLHTPDDVNRLAGCIGEIANMDFKARTERGADLYRYARSVNDIKHFEQSYCNLLSEVVELEIANSHPT